MDNTDSTTTQNKIRETLQELMRRGWTKAAIGEEIGVSGHAIGYWARGERYPSADKLIFQTLEKLLERKQVPKRRRYPGTHHTQRKAQDSR